MSEPDEVRHEIPPEFLDRLSLIVPAARLDAIMASFSAVKPTSFRLNTLADNRDCIIKEVSDLEILMKPVQWLTSENHLPIAFQSPPADREKLTYSSLIETGKIYIQNLSSMLAPIVLDSQPGETVLDLAAAPGGKTTQIAQMMNNEGVLSAVEAVRGRMYKLQANLKRCHVHIAKTYLTDGRSVGRKTPERFDRVLLDAPCSSEARFRVSDPSTWANWSPRKIRESTRKQFGLLKAAVHATKPGGRIVYCTCSFAPEENEQVIHRILHKFGEAVEVVPFDLPVDNWMAGLPRFQSKEFNPQVMRCRRILPNEGMDAFFIACIEKKGTTQSL